MPLERMAVGNDLKPSLKWWRRSKYRYALGVSA
jgi:hypothetical protein